MESGRTRNRDSLPSEQRPISLEYCYDRFATDVLRKLPANPKQIFSMRSAFKPYYKKTHRPLLILLAIIAIILMVAALNNTLWQ
jgi:hypothetical protein